MSVLELPAEILGKIFDHYVHDRWKVRQVDSDRPLSKLRCISAYSDSRTHPVDLTHVCQLWRTTAISMPQLWATIYASQMKSEGDVKMFELWLERSAGRDGTYPLILSVKQSARAPVDLREFFSLAISQHRRWKYIRLGIDGGYLPFFELLHTVAPLSTLCGFQVDFFDLNQRNRESLQRLIGVLCSSTALRSVEFGDESSGHNPIVVPWDSLSLTTLSFCGLELGHLIRILSSSMDTLRDISVTILQSPLSLKGLTPIPNVTMHRLQSLRIKSYGYGCHASVAFDKLTLPTLHKLYLPWRFTPNKDSELQTRGWESLLSLLERSNCKLQAFEFGDGDIPDLVKNLESPLFEHLTSLQVTSNFYVYPDITQLLDALSEVCEETQRPRMLPLLETLIFKALHSEDDVRVASVAAYGGCGKSKLRRVFTQNIEAGENALEMDLKDQE
ncbi:hypothetical protein H1R20_g1876, partial [Candolleomyces eurysporus]